LLMIRQLLDAILQVIPAKELEEGEEPVLTPSDFEIALVDDQVKRLLARLQVSNSFTPYEVFAMLDDEGNAELSHDGFIMAFYRLMDEDVFEQKCLNFVSVNQTKMMSKKIQAILDELAATRYSINIDDVIKIARDKERALHRKAMATQVFGDVDGEDAVLELQVSQLAQETTHTMAEQIGKLVEQVDAREAEVRGAIDDVERRLEANLQETCTTLTATLDTQASHRFSSLVQHLDRRLQAVDDKVVDTNAKNQRDLCAVVQTQLEKVLELTESAGMFGAAPLAQFKAQGFLKSMAWGFRDRREEIAGAIDEQDKDDPAYLHLLHPDSSEEESSE